MATTFSFGPSGTWSPFNAGVAMYLLQNVDFDRSSASAYVVSGGALGLSLLLYDDPYLLYQRMRGACEIMAQLKTFGILAPFHTSRICRQGLDYFLPDDAHLRLENRVHIGLTHFPSLKPVIVTGPFATKGDLMNALLASSYIPGFFATSYVPGFGGYIDGGFSHSYGPEPDRTVVVTIGHYPESDISYDNGKLHLQFSDAEGYMEIFWLGYYSAYRSRDRIIAKLSVASR